MNLLLEIKDPKKEPSNQGNRDQSRSDRNIAISSEESRNEYRNEVHLMSVMTMKPCRMMTKDKKAYYTQEWKTPPLMAATIHT